jgi:deoxyribonuclease V
MQVAHLHPWDVSPREAMRLQRELASRVLREGVLDAARVHYVAGADVAFDKPNRRGVAAAVLLAYPSLETVECVTVEAPVTFPYVPGLLSFRETPLLLNAFERLRGTPDLVMIDGHGYAHPRRCGFACHVGLLLDVPTIGVAKSRLVGAHAPVAPARGSRADLLHEDEVVGSLLRTREDVRPVYVSVGHRIGLRDAERWVLACAAGRRVPAPTRLADALAGAAKRRMVEATLEIVIEQRQGERGRWAWDAERDEVVYQRDQEPMPAHYGCSVDIINPADGELLDVMLVDARVPERGERRSARIVDVLQRADGDDKLLAVPADAGTPPLDGVRERAVEYYLRLEKPVERWGGEDAAVALIASCRSRAAPGQAPVD